MIQNLFPTSLTMTLFGVAFFTFIMLLPALLELKKPKDAGPRKIVESCAADHPQMRVASLEKVEEFKVDRDLLKKLAEVISVLPSLEG